ncbi:DUF3482 domain-containing protein [Diaphorobacter sp. HDW4A]|uniref:DUF3482 domain-containing protein n=1 Tax=Diaphorobacter sp. HDW4A TaxID=2714924 RepID=UPI00140C262E|nr:DUF3482 domain-containing protein [Diaphorobacter sp. HDW4A]QIL82776.1 DUF3482 domain-containing protein [Diaphorobacter sp. HDW4A]
MPETNARDITALQTNAPATSTQQIQWCLLSHTNIGKTTLTRTLLADDVGEIQDAAHVTSQSQRYLLQTTAQGDQLWLWDTPGFGDSVRLYERLKQQGNPLGWFLSNVWDRWRDKPFYMSQRALVAARDHADVMLYLVNAAEDPADAGYWEAEMRILAWMHKPVIILLNQIGSDTTPEQTAADLERWRTAVQSFSETVHDVLVLDAFTRSWWHERRMLQSIAPLLPADKLPAYERILAEREQRQLERELASIEALAGQLMQSALVEETAEQGASGKLWDRAVSTIGKISQKLGKTAQEDAPAEARDAMKRLLATLQKIDVRATQRLLQLHQLDGDAASQIQQQLKTDLQITTPHDTQAASLWGAVTAGAATGIGADLVTGGLTLGTGAILGALVGAVTFAGAAWGANKMFDQESQRFRLSDDYLTAMVSQALLKYIVISHFGRGRGRYTAPSAPQQWSVAVQAAVQQHAAQWQSLWANLRALPPQSSATDAMADAPHSPALQAERQATELLLQRTLAQVLQTLYPTLAK